MTDFTPDTPRKLTRMQDGFELHGLQNSRVELWIAPALGGKWVSLRDRRTAREWMWSPPQETTPGTPPRPKLFRAPDNNAFQTSCLVGADECIPTIAPSVWQGRTLPDHGEVWNLPWTVLNASSAVDFSGDTSSDTSGDISGDASTALTLQIDMPISPLRFTRRITLDENTLRVAYTLENLGAAHERFVWAFHPLLHFMPGDQLTLGAGIQELLLESAVGLDLGQRGAVCAWPSPTPGSDLTQLDLGGEERAAKFFTRPLAERDGWAKIHNPADQTALTYSFATDQISTLGIWLTRGGWNGFHHLAIEPGIGAPDPLDVAVNDWQTAGAVAPHSKTQWQFQLTIGS